MAKDEEVPEANVEGMEAAAEVELDLSTLVGGVRDAMLEVVKHRPKPWDQMLEEEQTDVAAAVQYAAKELVEQAVRLIRSDGEQSVKALLKSYSDKGEISVTATISRAEIESDPNLINLLHNAVGKYVVITNASADPYSETGGDAETDPDAPEFEMGSDAEEAPGEEAE